MKKADLQTLHAHLMQEKQQQVKNALALVGSFYDELLAMAEHANKSYVQSRRPSMSDLQTCFYLQCMHAGVTILTPRQQQMKQDAESEA